MTTTASSAAVTSAKTGADKPAVDMIESAKRKAAFRAVEDHFNPRAMFVGIGSGSTIIYGVEAIKEKLDREPHQDGRYIFFVRQMYYNVDY